MSTPKEGSRDIGDGIIVSLSPDVCKTPVGSSTPPIPYSVFAKQGEDANTAPTVKMTGKRAHNMASLVTKTHGDEPGTANGVKSGTVGAACHPKSHSGTVNIEGKPAIRHSDEWYMNNKNTVGKLTYVKSTETFEPTPAIDLSQNPESELPPGEAPSDFVQAILDGMERARTEGLPEGSFQVAQAQPQTVVPGASQPVTQPTTVPNSAPDTRVTTPPGAAANDNRPLNRVVRSPTVAPRGTGLAALALALEGVGFSNLMARDVGRLERNHGIVLDPDDPLDRAILAEYSRNRGPSELSRLYRGMDDDEAVEIVRGRLAERDALRAEAAAAADEETRAESEVTPDTVRVTGRDEEEPEEDDCDVRRYGSLTCPSGQQAHHIVPDSALRFGNRTEGEAGVNRIPGMPSFRDGMAICLTGGHPDPTGQSEHSQAHAVTDRMIRDAGMTGNPVGTTTVDVAKNAGIAGASAARPECSAQIAAAVQQQYAGIPGGRLVNAAGRPARGAALDALRAGQ